MIIPDKPWMAKGLVLMDRGGNAIAIFTELNTLNHVLELERELNELQEVIDKIEDSISDKTTR